MKKRITLVFIFLFLLSLFLDKAFAFTITGNASSHTTMGNSNPYSGGNTTGDVPSMESLTHPTTKFVGVLASLIDYDNTNGPKENVVKKVFFTTGNTGASTANLEAESYYKYGDYPDAYSTSTGHTYSCGNTDNHNRKIEHFFYSISFAAPTPSPSLVGVPQDPTYSFSDANLEGFISGTLLPAIIDEYNNSSPHTVMGYQIDEREFDTYYLKYEPVYRTYPPLAQKSDKNAGGFKPSENLHPHDTNPADSPLAEGEVKHYLDYKTKYPDESREEEFFRYKECEHEHVDMVWDTKRVNVDKEEDECKEAGNSWDSNGCYYNETVEVDDPNGKMVKCKVWAYYYFYGVSIQNIKSTMSTVREGYSSTPSKTAVLFAPYSLNAHEVLDEDKGLVEKGKTDYYIGTTPNNAIAISNLGTHKFDSSKHLYKLVNGGYESYAADKALGMGLYNLSEVLKIEKKKCDDPNGCLTCKDVCSEYIGDKSSDNYLRCAQSYCDGNIVFSPTEYATDLKRECILSQDQCDYHPKTPIDCDNPVNYKIINGAASDGTDGKTINNSTCGYTGSTYTDDNKTVNKQRGSYYFCQRMGSGSKAKDENGKTYYRYGVSNTTDSYINIECKENVGFDFKDLSGIVLRPGMGYEYATYLNGSKTCRIFFDTVSWEFDFASTHSYDSLRKRLLLQKVEAFNLLQTNKSGGVKVNGSELLGKVIDQEGTSQKLSLDDVEDDLIYLSALSYNINDDKASSSSQTTEYVDNSSNKEGNKVYKEGERFNLEVTDKSNPTSYNSTLKGKGLNLYHDYIFDEKRQINEEGTRDIYEYNISGSASITYQLPKLCSAADNRRTLDRTYDDSCDGLGALYNKSIPLREYFTSFKAKPHDSLNNMNNKVSVKKSYFTDSVSDSDEYLKGSDTCPYNVFLQNPQEISCEILLEKSATCYKSNDIYVTSDPVVTARLLVHNNTNDIVDVDTQRIELKGSSIAGEMSISFPTNDLKTTTNASGDMVSDNIVTLQGTVTAHSNDPTYTLTNPTVTCSKKLNIIKASTSCSITKSGTSYLITATGSGDVYATMSSNKDANGNLIFKKLTLVENGKYVYQVITDSKNEAIIAKVGNGASASYCTYIPTLCPELNACVELYTPTQTKKILDYCNKNYSIDKYHYDSPEACYDDCSTYCPTCNGKKFCVKELTTKQREDFNTVKAFCSGNDSVQLYDDCMDDCLMINPSGSSPYIYRSINLNNPFPSSSFSSSSGYQPGKRAIGQEWLINYDKITEDKEQVMNGTEPEYVVDLDISIINAIRNDTYTRNNGLKSGSIYSDTTNLPKVASCTSTGYQGYCSSFIHEDFNDYFKVVMGHKN